jgi:hypothetical protein
MRAAKPTLKRICVEAFGLAALLPLNQRSTNGLDPQASLLLTANEVANVLAVVRVVATLDQKFYLIRFETLPHIMREVGPASSNGH